MKYNLIVEYDEQKKIVHVSASEILHVIGQKNSIEFMNDVRDRVKEKLQGYLGYLIVDYSKIQIEPDNIEEYAEKLYFELKKLVHPNGYARYGFGIGRVTSKRISRYMEDEPPPLFHSKDEAYGYIYQLIERNVSKMEVQFSPIYRS